MKIAIVVLLVSLVGCYDKSISKNCGQGVDVTGCENGGAYERPVNKQPIPLIVP